MKKNLLLMMCCPVILSAQNGVTVSGLDVKSGTVTFNVSWKNTDMPTLWSDSVWVFVDYNNAGKMERLPLSGATLTDRSWSAASVTLEDGNNKGAWVVGNARTAGSFSATVKLHTATADLAGVCAYASNYPPVGEYTSSAKISFTGTPPYDLVLTSAGSGTHTYSINDNYYNLHGGETLQSFTDKTGAPGTMKCHAPGITGITFAAFNPCANAPYGSTYTLTDGRDGNQYKIKYMPDGRYWMVQDLKFGDMCKNKTTYTGSTSNQTGRINSTDTYYGECRAPSVTNGGYYYDWLAAMQKPGAYTSFSSYACSGTHSGTVSPAPSSCQGICPTQWHLPTYDEYQLLVTETMTEYSITAAQWWSSTLYFEGVNSYGITSAGKFDTSCTTIFTSSANPTCCDSCNGQPAVILANNLCNGCTDHPAGWGATMRCTMNY
jgi:uncharacterized protein (TIGR02145 family)